MVENTETFNRKVLVDNLQWPTSLAIDYPTKRLYWCDPKSSKVESVRFDGKNRQVVKTFDAASGIRPYKLEVFEDSLFITTYQKHDVIRMNKFGTGDVVYLGRGLTRISDILILQENKRPKLNNYCNDFCDNNEFCLLTPKGANCVCPDGFINANFTCKPYMPPPPECPLNCNMGMSPCSTNGAFFADDDCTKYWSCANGIAYEFSCPATLNFNPSSDVCDYAASAGCTGKGWDDPTEPYVDFILFYKEQLVECV
ncbi:hypothetical protein HUJ04_013441 [Dendroctonus ponderosae]|nr:hypothetical protein HUJ04_013441 [Dendroctonus ponderosae]